MADIADWRKKIDELDRRLVELVNERARCAQQVGRLKRNTQMPIYEPDRERIIFENIHKANQGPLPDRELTRIYERIIDVMRKLQEDEMLAAEGKPGPSADREAGETRPSAKTSE